jgi:hypothetical protein
MSAFVCSDYHIATIAQYAGILKQWEFVSIQALANRLKAINIQSVNYRYKENSRITKCKIDKYRPINSMVDIIQLIRCWDYQACEDRSNPEFIVYSEWLFSLFPTDKISESDKHSNLWSI